LSRFQSHKGQSSFEFIVILAVVLLVATFFILPITSESATSIILSSVKSTAEHEIALMTLTPGCANTSLQSMTFNNAANIINLNVIGCAIDLAAVAGTVETDICGAANHGSGASFTCSGVTYSLVCPTC